MKVAENDVVVQGMLQDEYERCFVALEALVRKLAGFPKGALNVRAKMVGGRSYSYHYLVAREGSRVVNRHVRQAELPELKRQIEERDRCRREIRSYRGRIAYLQRLLRIPRQKGSRRVSPA